MNNNRPLTGGFGGNPALKVGKPVNITTTTGVEEMEEEAGTTKIRSRKRRSVPFHNKYNQFTSYIDETYEPVLKKLMEEFEESKTQLVNEAFYDLFLKHHKTLEAAGIDVGALPPHPTPSKRPQ